MSSSFIGPIGKQEYRKHWNEVRKRMHIFFILILCFPVLAYLPFQFKWVKNKNSGGNFLTQPVALVITPNGTGTAFLTGKTRLLTAAHVLCGMNKGEFVDLIFQNLELNEGKRVKARILFLPPSMPANCNLTLENKTALETDFAVIELNPLDAPPDDITRFAISSSTNAQTMQNVHVIGYPGGSGIGSDIPNCTVTGGIISNIKISDLDLFQLNVTAFPGTSGGPLVLEKSNQFVGILIAGSPQFPGITLACKTDIINKVMKTHDVDLEK